MAQVRPWWDIFPKIPAKAVERTLDTPTVSPVGLLGLSFGKKTIIKTGGRFVFPALAGAGGLLLGRMFGGGGSQEQAQEQDVDVAPIIEPDIIPTVDPVITPTIAPTVAPIIGNITDSDIFGDIAPTNITENISTITETYQTTITETSPLTYTLTGASQEATQKPDNTLLLVIGAVAIGAMFLMKGK